MIRAVKVRLRPTKAQEIQLRKSAGVARFAYNWALERQKENHESGGKFLNDQALRKEFTQLKQTEEYECLYETSNNISKQAIKDACDAYKRFFKKQTGFPKFKSKRRSKPSFYNDSIKLKFKDERFLIEKVGWVRISEPERITTNKVAKTKKQSKKLRRLQRKVSRKYEKNKKGKEYVKTGNIIKLEKQIRLTHRKIANTRLNHIHQATTALVKTKPSRIVMEDLNVKGMMKNRHLSKAIGEQGFNLFLVILAYKCAFYGIELIEADRFCPSSKTCCKCGYIKKDLKLSERTYKCPVCNNEIDRDYQASINLARYSSSA